MAARTLKFLAMVLGWCVAAGTANAQRGAVSDFSGAGVAGSAFIGAFHPKPATTSPNAAVSEFAMHAIAFNLGTALNGGTVAGGGFTTSGFGVQALGRLLAGPAAAVAVERRQVGDALRPSGALQAPIDRLLSALTGLLAAPTAERNDELPRSTMRELPPPDAGASTPSSAAIREAAAAFHDVVNSSSAPYLRNPPQEFRAIYSTLFELICTESTSAGVANTACAPPSYVIDQPAPIPLVNQDSIDAVARATAEKARADSAAVAAARARADTIAAVARATETAHARAVLETRVFFDADQFALTADARALLDTKIQVLKANLDVRLRIEGHVDAREVGDFNRALGKLRAEQARSYLIAHGIGYARIDIVDRGATRPACTESRDSCRQRNRRDEFIIVAGGAQR
ncbi:MAG: OmpA family protein [Gemmatimonadaceae bacterium]